jgi:hypothetical protein
MNGFVDSDELQAKDEMDEEWVLKWRIFIRNGVRFVKLEV